MPLVLLSLSRVEFLAQTRAAEKGGKQAYAAVAALWDEYKDDTTLECFLCGTIIDYPHPPFSLLSPELNNNDKLIAAPWCSTCRDLPSQLRWHRALKMLGAMWSKKGKKFVSSVVPSIIIQDDRDRHHTTGYRSSWLLVLDVGYAAVWSPSMTVSRIPVQRLVTVLPPYYAGRPRHCSRPRDWCGSDAPL